MARYVRELACTLMLLSAKNGRTDLVRYRRTALLKETSSTEIRDKYIYNVTAVVTPKSKLRETPSSLASYCSADSLGRGFARHLLKLLHYELAPPEALPPFPEAEWGPPPPPLSERDRADIPPSLASALWSIVGNFYEKAGYIIQEEHLMQIKWSLRAPTSSEPPPKRSWIYSSDLPAIGAELSEVKRAELSSQQGTSWSIDPSSKGVLSYIPTRVLRPRSQDWNEVYDHEAVGIRLPPIKAGQGEAIVLFSNALSLLPGLLVLYVHNLEADRLPTLLEALDEASVAAGTKEGLLWGLAEDSALSKAWLSQPGREASIARRGDAENQLAVAWYGGHEEKGRVVDSQLWTCA